MKPDPANEIRAAFPERDPADPGHAKLAAALTETPEEREARISAGVAALAAAKAARRDEAAAAPSLLVALKSCADLIAEAIDAEYLHDDSHPTARCILAEARAAIARTEGGVK